MNNVTRYSDVYDAIWSSMFFVRKSKTLIQIMAPFELLPYQLNEKDEVIYLVLSSALY